MARLFKPQVMIDNETLVFNTYAEIKKRMKSLIDKSSNNEVFVTRSRRGEWGEWFEYWHFNSERKPVIIKQGWQ